jgi:hypothetical protein
MDNQSAITITKNLEFHDQTKHIEVRHHFLCHKVERDEISLAYMPTGDQIVDTLMKGLCHEKHKRFSKEMGICRLT